MKLNEFKVINQYKSFSHVNKNKVMQNFSKRFCLVNFQFQNKLAMIFQ